MSLAVHLTNAYEPRLRMPLDPWPEGLDQRWTVESVNDFLAAAHQFVKETSFREFFETHRALYETAESRMKALLEKEGHLEWFKAYFGERPQATLPWRWACLMVVRVMDRIEANRRGRKNCIASLVFG